MPCCRTNISLRGFALSGNRHRQTHVEWPALSHLSRMLATNMPRILQGVLAKTTILVVVLQFMETCYGREPLDGFDEFAGKALEAFGTPGMSVAVVQDGKVAFVRGYGRRKLGDDAAVNA